MGSPRKATEYLNSLQTYWTHLTGDGPQSGPCPDDHVWPGPNAPLLALRDVGNTTTLSGYLSLLDASGLLGGLQKYANDTARRRASVPKMQVHDNALRSHYANRTFANALADPEEWGRCVESAVGAHLLSRAASGGYEVLYWRDGGLEVDYVLRRRGRLAAIEVKTTAATSTDGLAAFRTRFSPAASLIVGPSGLPLPEFLSTDPADFLC